MNLLNFSVLLSAAIVAWPVAAAGQQWEKVIRIPPSILARDDEVLG